MLLQACTRSEFLVLAASHKTACYERHIFLDTREVIKVADIELCESERVGPSRLGSERVGLAIADPIRVIE